jgi:hypothetical protein
MKLDQSTAIGSLLVVCQEHAVERNHSKRASAEFDSLPVRDWHLGLAIVETRKKSSTIGDAESAAMTCEGASDVILFAGVRKFRVRSAKQAIVTAT